MLIAYASRTGTRRNLDALRGAGWRLLVSATGCLRHEGFPYALDNGAWSAFQKGQPFDESKFVVALRKLGRDADWTVIPDIVAGGEASLEFSLRWMRQVLDECGRGLIAVQDGWRRPHEGRVVPRRPGEHAPAHPSVLECGRHELRRHQRHPIRRHPTAARLEPPPARAGIGQTVTYEPPAKMIEQARRVACNGPCAKSKRGVVAYIPPSPEQGFALFATAFNGPPPPFKCTASDACRANCAKLCIHAESRALARLRELDTRNTIHEFVLLHVKVENNCVVPSTRPSCWQCSRELVEAGVAGIWLYEARVVADPSWTFYTAIEFHRETLRNLGLQP